MIAVFPVPLVETRIPAPAETVATLIVTPPPLESLATFTPVFPAEIEPVARTETAPPPVFSAWIASPSRDVTEAAEIDMPPAPLLLTWIPLSAPVTLAAVTDTPAPLPSFRANMPDLPPNTGPVADIETEPPPVF